MSFSILGKASKLVNGWNMWDTWEVCSVTCAGVGSQMRSRGCHTGNCEGLAGAQSETVECGFSEQCPGIQSTLC